MVAPSQNGAGVVHTVLLHGLSGATDVAAMASYNSAIAFVVASNSGVEWYSAIDMLPRALGANVCDEVVVGDFNGDGHQDVVGVSSVAGTVTWWLGQGDGVYAAGVDVAFAGANLVQKADMDMDGVLDVVVASSSTGDVQWCSAALQCTAVGNAVDINDIAVGLYDNNDHGDVLVGTSTGMLAFISSNAGASFLDARTIGNEAVLALEVANMDKSGRPDIVYASADRKVKVMQHRSGYYFMSKVAVAAEHLCDSVAIATLRTGKNDGLSVVATDESGVYLSYLRLDSVYWSATSTPARTPSASPLPGAARTSALCAVSLLSRSPLFTLFRYRSGLQRRLEQPLHVRSRA